MLQVVHVYPRGAALKCVSDARLGRRCAVLIVLWLSALFLFVGPASAGGRVALVIGNADYRLETMKLSNPANDARAVAEKLGAVGFDVTLRTNLARAEMTGVLESFSTAAKGADMAVLFFAGHGIQKDGENYLLARDFADLSLAALADASLSIGEVQKAITAAKPRIGIVIIDACRNNPFAEQGIVAPGLARASGGAGLLFAYSTDPGNVAYDGEGENSQFTEALLRHLDSPGLDVRLMFGRVRQSVLLDTGGAQIPWVEESVIGEHSFSTAPLHEAGSAVAREIERWREVSGQPGVAPYQKFLREFPNGLFGEFAEQKIRQQQALSAVDMVVGEGVADQDRPLIAASLSVLGFLPADRGMPDDLAIRRGLAAYGAQTGAGAVDPERLALEASRTLTLLGAKTAQQLRTDMTLLKAVETATEMAERALVELEGMARISADANAILPQARADLDAIHARRAELLDQLDAGRDYYSELLEIARRDFEPTIHSIARSWTMDARATERLRDRHGSDIETFVRHVADGETESDGSYSWLIDFLPG